MERSLNFVNFPEFHVDLSVLDHDAQKATTKEVRLEQKLMTPANWERQGAKNAMAELEGMEETEEGMVKKLRVFMRMTDLFG